MSVLLWFLFIVISLIGCVYFSLRHRYTYWYQMGVVHDKPAYLYGNLREMRRTKAFRDPFYEFYMKYKNSSLFGGFYLFFRYAAIPFDLDLIRDILISDFNKFSARGNYYNERDDPLSAHLFNLDGPKWKSMRAKLTPTFTSGKMKMMFPTIVEVGEKLVEVLTQATQSKEPIEIKEYLARFTTDVIGTCAFGLDCNSLQNPNTQFRVMGRQIFKNLRHSPVVIGLIQAFPEYARVLRLKIIPDHLHEFFMNVVRETVKYREKATTPPRNDFMNLLIELKNNNEIDGLTLDQIAAQAFVFFVAGFETSSSTMGFSLYELALHQDIQNKARDEINEMYKRNNEQITYEGIRELKYLHQIFRETMRMYSIATILFRKCVEDYKLQKTGEIIEKGTVILIPVDAIHRDPDIYPNPEVFDPERFRVEEMEKRHPMTFLPFGDGPKNCIGTRFGEMQGLVGLALLLRHFRFSAAPETPIPIEIDKQSFILASKGGILLKVETIK